MSQPTTYNRSTSFANFQAANPTSALSGVSVDLELNNVKQTLDQVLVNLALIQNDDTTVKNASIGINQLSASAVLGFNPVRTWVTGTAYTASPASTVFNGSSIYICLISHTGGVFATDLAAGKWQLILNLAAIPITAASQVSVVASGVLTTDAQTSLQALDTGKAATSHIHVSTAITDSSAIGRTILTAADAATIVAALGLTNSFTTGDVKLTIKTVADAGWIMMNDGTIGDAFSGATFADASAQSLFTLLWTNFIDTWAPVSTGRGANAAADWAAHKTIGTLKVLGRALAISGAGAALTSRALGQTLGEETHLLTQAELSVNLGTAVSTVTGTPSLFLGPAVVQTGSAGSGANFPTSIAPITVTTTITNASGGNAHNNMQPTSFLNAMIKL